MTLSALASHGSRLAPDADVARRASMDGTTITPFSVTLVAVVTAPLLTSVSTRAIGTVALPPIVTDRTAAAASLLADHSIAA